MYNFVEDFFAENHHMQGHRRKFLQRVGTKIKFLQKMKKFLLLMGFAMLVSFSQRAVAQNLFFADVSGSSNLLIHEQSDEQSLDTDYPVEYGSTLVSAPPVDPSVTIRLTSDGKIAAWVQDDPANPKTAFLLQTSSTPTLVGSTVLTNSTVSYAGNCVTFTSRSGQVVIFKLSGATCSTPAGATVYQGNGLTRQSGTAINNAFVGVGTGGFPPVIEFSCTCSVTGTSASNCNSGGVGATECSTGSSIVGVSTSCSVSCGSGYFACCVE